MNTFSHTAMALGWIFAAGIVAAACASDQTLAGSNASMGEGTDAAAGGAGGAGGGSSGSCTPAFCPTGAGEACCVTANGPCGLDYGNGCVSTVPDDAGP